MSYRFAPWEGATNCTAGPQPGTVAMQAYLLERFRPPGWSGGIYNCRAVRGGATTSTHGEGRAFDLMFPVGANGQGTELGHSVVHLLGSSAARLGLQAIIYDRTIWSATSPSGRRYNGVHPHYDHLHIEQTRASARNLTLTTLRTVLGTVGGRDLTDEEAEMFAARYGDSSGYVRRLQRLINAASARGGGHGISVRLVEDGRYGPATRDAVNAFAARAGMPTDGATGCHVLVVDYLRNWLSG